MDGRKTGKVLIITLWISVGILAVLLLGYGFISGLSNGSSVSFTAYDDQGDEEDKEEQESAGKYASKGDTTSDAQEADIELGEAEKTIPPLEDGTGVIYIGDSRFVGMNDVCGVTHVEGRFVVAEVGQGYYWLRNTAISQAANVERIHPEITKWKYVICMGINDLVEIEKYLELYKQLMVTKDIILVSVGPVGSYPGLTNERVAEFNTQLQTLGLPYIDYYSVLMTEGYYAGDGLHYSDDTYEKIYRVIIEKLGDTAAQAMTGE